MTSPNDEDRVARGLEAIDARFIETNANLVELVKGVHEETAARNAKVDAIKRFTQISVVLIVLVLLSLGFLGVTVRSQNKAAEQRSAAATAQRTQQQEDTKKLLEAINGCTQPGGACFRANRDDTAAALGLLQQFQYAVGYCAATHPGDGSAYRACVLSYKVPGAPTSLPAGK